LTFSLPPAKVWHWVPGSIAKSKKGRSRKLLFPARYDVEALLSDLERLPISDREYHVDLRGEEFFVETTPTYRRKSYRREPAPVLPVRTPAKPILTSITIEPRQLRAPQSRAQRP